jgi:hypothetical protein
MRSAALSAFVLMTATSRLPEAGIFLQGHGLINIERRARLLGGSHAFGRSLLGGASISVRVPLGLNSQPMPLE